MKSKFKVLIAVSALFVIAILLFLLCFNNVPVIRSDKMYLHNIENILDDYGKTSSSCNLLSAEDAAVYAKTSNTSKKLLGNLESNQSALYLNFRANPKDYDAPIELYALMHTYLYIKDLTFSSDIIAIVCTSNSGYLSSPDSALVVISIAELDKLYSSFSDTSDTKLLAQQMATKWMDINYYNREYLVLDNEDLYNCFTQWNLYVNSHDGDFSVGYDYERNRLNVLEIPMASMTRHLTYIDIEEQGKILGCWDMDNNIWLIGETSGITMLKYDGNDSWSFSDNYDPNDIPAVLKNFTW